MQIIIDIDEDTYRYMQSRCKYQNKGDKGLSKFEEAGVAIKNGTPFSTGYVGFTNSEWIDFLAEQFDISRTSAKEMLHVMMSVKKEDNFKKQFSQGKKGFSQGLVKAERGDTDENG